MRYEIKIPIQKNLDYEFHNFISYDKNIKKAFVDRVINSIYFDTENLSSARNNLSGVSRRSKYRVRWYNKNLQNLNYEIKSKSNNLGKKIILKTNQDFKNLDNFYSIKNKFLNKEENNFFLGKIYDYDLKPVVKVSYIRSYYIYNNKVMITYDKNLNYELINKFQLKKNLFKDSMNVIEVKFNKEDYKLGSNLILSSNFYPKRFSKYLRSLYSFNIANYI
jgi:hypothetical protein